MDSNQLLLLRCQFFHHIFHCKKCIGNGLLPDSLCHEATIMLNSITLYGEMEEDMEEDGMNNPFENRWVAGERGNGKLNPLFSFWPGTN